LSINIYIYAQMRYPTNATYLGRNRGLGVAQYANLIKKSLIKQIIEHPPHNSFQNFFKL